MTINKVGSKAVAKYQSMHFDKKGGRGRWVGQGIPGMTCLQRVTFLHDGRSTCMCVIDPWTDVCTAMTLH